MRVKFVSLGCKVNQCDTQALQQLFLHNGYTLAEGSDADIAVINSCTVTSLADRKTRQLLRRIRRDMPSCITVLTGCMPQSSPDEAKKLLEADIITGTRDRAEILSLVEKYIENQKRTVAIKAFDSGEKFENLSADKFDDSFQRAYLKIEDGCDRFCSYCIIPYARGRVRSRSLADITAQTEKLAQSGYREIVLTGINISRYGFDTGSSLLEAIRACAAARGDFRIRLGSVEPDLISEADWRAMAKIEKLCPHFHLPLQSGCDKTLARMNRRYTVSQFENTVSLIRSLFSGSSITADIIVGFPEETEEEFDETCRTVERLNLLRAHIFEYSPRSGTVAAAIKSQVAPQIKKQRSKRLTELCNASAEQFATAQIGKTVRVLLEATGGGYSDNYLYVNVSPIDALKTGDFINVILTGANCASCTGTPINL